MLNLYLLHAKQPKTPGEDAFIEALAAKVDAERLRKAERIQSAEGKVLSLAAGVLLQKGVKDLTEGCAQPFLELSTEELLSEIRTPEQIKYRYDENGKPYFEDGRAYFSLSHSGEYILLGISEKPIGVDIQKMQPLRFDEMAERFFDEEEAEKIRETCGGTEKTELFYRFWTKKEAYTKCHGLTLAKMITRPVCNSEEEIFVPVPAPEGYRAAVCILTVTEEK